METEPGTKEVLFILRLMNHYTQPPLEVSLKDAWVRRGFSDGLRSLGWSLEPEECDGPGIYLAYEGGFLAGVRQAGGDIGC